MRILRYPLPSFLASAFLAMTVISCGGEAPTNEAPRFTTHPIPQTAALGASVSFMVAASGQPEPSFTWERSADGTNWTAISGATSATCSFKVQASDHGARFRAKASNGVGSPVASNNAVLTVNSTPLITAPPVSQSLAAPGSVSFTVAASGQPEPGITWERSSDGLTWMAIDGADSATYTFMAQASDHGARFRATASNGIGTPATSEAAMLKVGSANILTLPLPGGVNLELVEIPAGSYLMGRYANEADSFASEGPQHRVTIGQEFYMGRFEVSQAQWLAITKSNPAHYSLVGGGSSSDNLARPVEQVSWDMIRTSGTTPSFLEALNEATASTRPVGMAFRLPTEAEWEYACRAGASTPTRFYWGDDAGYSLMSAFGWCNESIYSTHPVGTKTANAFALHDMSGNVMEWCEDDVHDSYASTGTNPSGGGTIPTRPDDGGAWIDAGTRGTTRVLRGGSYYDSGSYCRSAYRYGSNPSNGYALLGLRVVLSAR